MQFLPVQSSSVIHSHLKKSILLGSERSTDPKHLRAPRRPKFMFAFAFAILFYLELCTY